MALYSLRLFENWSETGFVMNGVFFMASKDQKQAISANAEMLDRIGVRSEILSKDDARRRFPELYLDDCDYLLLEPESGYADPVATAISYAKKAEGLGTEILLGNGVSRLLCHNGRLEGVELADGKNILLLKGDSLHQRMDEQAAAR